MTLKLLKCGVVVLIYLFYKSYEESILDSANIELDKESIGLTFLTDLMAFGVFTGLSSKSWRLLSLPISLEFLDL